MKVRPYFLILLLVTTNCAFNPQIKDCEEVFIAILGDDSGSRNGQAKMDSVFYVSLKETIIDHSCSISLFFHNASDEFPNPIIARTEEIITLDKYNPDYPKLKAIADSIYLQNSNTLDAFNSQIAKQSIVRTMNTARNQDYTYLERHLNQLLLSLNDSSYDLRVLFIESDMLEHGKGANERPISKQIISKLNAAIDGGAAIYIVETRAEDIVQLKQLQARYLSHHLEFIRELKKLFDT